jgi:flagellar basal body-associated protein FliL
MNRSTPYLLLALIVCCIAVAMITAWMVGQQQPEAPQPIEGPEAAQDQGRTVKITCGGPFTLFADCDVTQSATADQKAAQAQQVKPQKQVDGGIILAVIGGLAILVIAGVASFLQMLGGVT